MDAFFGEEDVEYKNPFFASTSEIMQDQTAEEKALLIRMQAEDRLYELHQIKTGRKIKGRSKRPRRGDALLELVSKVAPSKYYESVSAVKRK